MRLKFSICLNVINAQMIAANTISTMSPTYIDVSKATNAPIGEDRDTYLEIFKEIKKARIPRMKANGENARNTPAVVATDFPPLNFAKIG
jgi:hypothetical protein